MAARTSAPGSGFYARWIAANALAEGLGLGGTLLLAHYVVGTMESARPDAWTLLLGALLAVALGTVLEGAAPAAPAARAIGMAMVFAGMHVLAWDAGPLAIAAGVVALCTLVGAVVGALHGCPRHGATPRPSSLGARRRDPSDPAQYARFRAA